jgi:hypothetical protein
MQMSRSLCFQQWIRIRFCRELYNRKVFTGTLEGPPKKYQNFQGLFHKKFVTNLDARDKIDDA